MCSPTLSDILWGIEQHPGLLKKLRNSYVDAGGDEFSPALHAAIDGDISIDYLSALADAISDPSIASTSYQSLLLWCMTEYRLTRYAAHSVLSDTATTVWAIVPYGESTREIWYPYELTLDTVRAHLEESSQRSDCRIQFLLDQSPMSGDYDDLRDAASRLGCSPLDVWYAACRCRTQYGRVTARHMREAGL